MADEIRTLITEQKPGWEDTVVKRFADLIHEFEASKVQVGLFKDDYERERRDRESYYDKNEVEKIELRSTINYQEQQIKALRTRAGVGEYQQGAQSQNRDETLKRELAAVTQSKIKCEQELEWYKEKLRRLQQISAESKSPYLPHHPSNEQYYPSQQPPVPYAPPNSHPNQYPSQPSHYPKQSYSPASQLPYTSHLPQASGPPLASHSPPPSQLPQPSHSPPAQSPRPHYRQPQHCPHSQPPPLQPSQASHTSHQSYNPQYQQQHSPLPYYQTPSNHQTRSNYQTETEAPQQHNCGHGNPHMFRPSLNQQQQYYEQARRASDPVVAPNQIQTHQDRRQSPVGQTPWTPPIVQANSVKGYQHGPIYAYSAYGQQREVGSNHHGSYPRDYSPYKLTQASGQERFSVIDLHNVQPLLNQQVPEANTSPSQNVTRPPKFGFAAQGSSTYSDHSRPQQRPGEYEISSLPPSQHSYYGYHQAAAQTNYQHHSLASGANAATSFNDLSQPPSTVNPHPIPIKRSNSDTYMTSRSGSSPSNQSVVRNRVPSPIPTSIQSGYPPHTNWHNTEIPNPAHQEIYQNIPGEPEHTFELDEDTYQVRDMGIENKQAYTPNQAIHVGHEFAALQIHRPNEIEENLTQEVHETAAHVLLETSGKRHEAECKERENTNSLKDDTRVRRKSPVAIPRALNKDKS